jgi:hypothetical protein
MCVRLTDILLCVDYYEAFPDLAGVYLEDSWVLEVAPTAEGVSLRLEAVLTPEHPRYHPPALNKQYCYRTGWLTLTSDAIDVRLSGRQPYRDPDGSQDFGNIDSFDTSADGAWEMYGDWGSVKISQPRVTLNLD